MKNITFISELPLEVKRECIQLIRKRMTEYGYTQTEVDDGVISFLENKLIDIIGEDCFITNEDFQQILIGCLLKVNC